MSGGTVCGTIPADAGKKNAETKPFSAAISDEHPELGAAGEEERGEHALGRHAREVRADHDRVPRQAGRHSTPPTEDEDDLRDRPGGQHEPEVALRAGHVQHGERERDVRHRVAEERHRPAREQQPELAVAERA